MTYIQSLIFVLILFTLSVKGQISDGVDRSFLPFASSSDRASTTPGKSADLSNTGAEELSRKSSPRSGPIEKAFGSAKAILEGNNECSRFFGGPGALEPLSRLVDSFEISFAAPEIGIHMTGSTTLISSNTSGMTYRIFQHEALNRRGAFFNSKRFPADPPVPRVGSFAPATPEAQVLMILHELGHMIRGNDGLWLLPDDGGSASLSNENTNRIEQECSAQIRRARRNNRAQITAETTGTRQL